MHTLICFHNDDNLETLYAISPLKPRCIHLIYDTDLIPDENIYEFQHYLKNNHYKVHQTHLSLSASIDSIKKELESIAPSAGLLLPQYRSAFSYNLLLALNKSSLNLFTTDDEGTIYACKENIFAPLPLDYSLTIKDLIVSRGGRIDIASTSFFEDSKLTALLQLIEDNLNDYYQLFRYSSNPPFYQTHREESRRLDLNTADIAAKYMPFFNAFINFLKEKNLADIRRFGKTHYRVTFHDKRYKSYLLKTGTWLEHRLYIIFKKLGFQDVQASIAFLWDKDYPRAKNECDVMGMFYNRLFMASCKDTHHLSPDYINELYANANHLAQTDTKAVLFTTARLSPGIQEKANEFNVTLLTYDGHLTQPFLETCKQKLFET